MCATFSAFVLTLCTHLLGNHIFKDYFYSSPTAVLYVQYECLRKQMWSFDFFRNVSVFAQLLGDCTCAELLCKCNQMKTFFHLAVYYASV